MSTLPDLIEKRGCSCMAGWAAKPAPGLHAKNCPIAIAADLRSGALGADEEPEAPLIYKARGDERELWAVVAHRAGKWHKIEPMTPLSPKRFPFCGNYDEVQERVRLMMKDPAFRSRWRGYYIAGARVDGQVMA